MPSPFLAGLPYGIMDAGNFLAQQQDAATRNQLAMMQLQAIRDQLAQQQLAGNVLTPLLAGQPRAQSPVGAGNILPPSAPMAPQAGVGGLPQGGGGAPLVKGSWFGNAPGWVDTTTGPTQASGLPISAPGIALPSRSTLGQSFDVTTPDGRTFRETQTDIGPAAWTGRGIDVNAAAARQMGYTPQTFPTDKQFAVSPAGGGRQPAQSTDGASPDPMALGQVAAQTFPMETWGRNTLIDAARRIEEIAPDAPGHIKIAALQQIEGILAPEERAQLTATMRMLQLQQGEERIQNQRDRLRWEQQHGLDVQAGKNWQLTVDPRTGEPMWARPPQAGETSGETMPAGLAPGTKKLGTETQPRSMPAIVMQKQMEAFEANNPDATPQERADAAMAAATAYRRNQAIETSFGSGIQGRNLVSLNTLADHIALFRQYAEALKTGNIQLKNKVEQRLATETGSPEVINFALAGTVTGDETVRLLTTTGGTLADRSDIHNLMAAYGSPDQLQGAADTLENYVRGRYAPLRQQYARGDAAREAYFDNNMVTPEARALFQAPMRQPAGPAPKGGAGGTQPGDTDYKTPEDVAKALDAGKITEDQARQLMFKYFRDTIDTQSGAPDDQRSHPPGTVPGADQ